LTISIISSRHITDNTTITYTNIRRKIYIFKENYLLPRMIAKGSLLNVYPSKLQSLNDICLNRSLYNYDWSRFRFRPVYDRSVILLSSRDIQLTYKFHA